MNKKLLSLLLCTVAAKVIALPGDMPMVQATTKPLACPMTVDPAQPNPNLNKIKNLVIFGDSLSDNGNLFNFTRGIMPAEKDGYWNGRFSDGCTAVEYLAQMYNWNLQDKAVGGELANVKDAFDNAIPVYLPLGAPETIQYYKNHDGFSKRGVDSLYIVEFGANDVLSLASHNKHADDDKLHHFGDDVKAYLDNSVQILKSQIEDIANNGGRYILVTNLPDIGRTPEGSKYNLQYQDTALHDGYQGFFGQATKYFNDQMNKVISYEASKYADKALIVPVDLHQFFEEELTKLGNQGVNTSSYCFSEFDGSQTDTINSYMYANGFNQAAIPELDAAKLINQTGVATPNAATFAKVNPSENGGRCTNRYFFSDHVHPSTQVHADFAKYIQSTISKLPKIIDVKFTNDAGVVAKICLSDGGKTPDQCISGINEGQIEHLTKRSSSDLTLHVYYWTTKYKESNKCRIENVADQASVHLNGTVFGVSCKVND